MSYDVNTLRVGDKVRRIWGRTRGDLYHVRGIVDNRVVMRTWSPEKQRWRYVIEGATAFSVGLYSLGCAICKGEGCETCNFERAVKRPSSLSAVS